MSIGKAYREIQAAKRKAEAEIHKARWEHPLVARPTAQTDDPSKHHHAKTRARHDSIMTKTIGAEEQFDLKSTPQTVIDEVKKILESGTNPVELESGKPPKKKKKKGDHILVHGKDDDESIERTDNDASSYTDHSFKEMAISPALDRGAGPSSPINTDADSIRSGFSSKISTIKKKVDDRRGRFQKVRKVLNKKGES